MILLAVGESRCVACHAPMFADEDVCDICQGNGIAGALVPCTPYNAAEAFQRKAKAKAEREACEKQARLDAYAEHYGNPDMLESETSYFGDIDVSNLARLASLMGVDF